MARANETENPTPAEPEVGDPYTPEDGPAPFDGERLEEPPIGEKPKPVRRTTTGAWVTYVVGEPDEAPYTLTLYADEVPALREVALSGGSKGLAFVPWGSSLEAELEASRKH